MSGTETGNVLIQDKVESDSFIWKYKKADRNGRIRYPSEVGNLMKETTEQVVTTAGAIASAQFMTGRVLFSGAGAQGASTLPSALTILTLLNMYYDFTKRTAIYTNTNSVANRISSEISVEFSNRSGNTVTLAQGTGNTFVGFTSPVTIPDNAVLRLKFVILTSSPTPAFEVYIDGGNISQFANTLVTPPVLTLPIQAPDQLVVYDPATSELGYVVNAGVQAMDVNDNFMGWDTTTSTISKNPVLATAPFQLFTRDTTTGFIYNTPFASVPSGTAATFAPIALDSGTGRVVLSPNTGVDWRNRNGGGNQLVVNLADDNVLYPQTAGLGTFTYNAGTGTFTATVAGLFHFDVTCTTDVVAAGSHFHLQVNGVDFAGTGYFATQTTATISAARSLGIGEVIQVKFSNQSGGGVNLVAVPSICNDFKAVRVGP